MFRFFKRQRRSPAPEEEASDADLAAAAFIQQKAQVGAMFGKRLADPDEDFNAQLRHYESVREDLLGRLDAIEDDFSRWFASCQLIKMCMAANDVAVARALLAGIRDRQIREHVFDDFPELQR